MPIKSPYGDIAPTTESLHDELLRAIDNVIAKEPNKKALIKAENSGEFLTYKELKMTIHHVAEYLNSIGFIKQIACSVVQNCVEFAPFFTAVLIQGGAISGASALFTDCALLAENAVNKVGTFCSNTIYIKIIVIGEKEKESKLPAGCVTWQTVVTTPIHLDRPKVKVDINEDVAILPYSSGTTGSPKGVMLTHRNFGTMQKIIEHHRARLQSVLDSTPGLTLTPSHNILFLPFYHIYGFGVLYATMLEGSTGIIMSHFDLAVFCKAIQNYKVETVRIVPPILVMLAKNPLISKFDLSSLRAILCGAAPAGKDLCEEVKKKFPNLLYVQQGYGMTEVSLASHLPDEESFTKFGTVGKLAPGYIMKIVKVDTDEECEVNEPGEICLKGPTIMKGYLNRPEATAEAIHGGWLHTGDIGYVDADGDLYIVDRLKELIKVKGLQVAPAELEDLLLTHPRIRDVAVIGVPDPAAGELPKAFVVRSDESLTPENVMEFVKDKVSSYKQLKGGVEFIEEIPKSASGKILRRTLRDRQKSKI